MADVPNDELNTAIDLWLYAQATQPSWVKDYIRRHGGRSPFDPWPPEKSRVDEFLRWIKDSPLQSTASENLPTTIDPKKREELLEEFAQEYGKVKAGQTAAESAAKERVQSLIHRTLVDTTIPPNQKERLFRAMTNEAKEHASATDDQIVARATAVIEDAQPFFREPEESERSVRRGAFLSRLHGKNAAQAAAAPFEDALLAAFPGLKQGVLNRNFEDSLKRMLDVPNRLIETLGITAADQPIFRQMIRRAQADFSARSGTQAAGNLLTGITSAIFRSSFDRTATESIRTYWEVYRINVTKGLPPPNANQFMASGMRLGSVALNVGKDVAVQKIGGAAISGIAAKLGLAAIPGGWVASLFFLGKDLLGKAAGWFMRLAIPRSGEVPGDRWIAGLGCGVLLFIFGIGYISQLMIDSALVSHLQTGGSTTGVGFGEYPGAPAIPSNITGCPTKNQFQLTQCPGSTAFSHKNLWAYDIGLPNGTPVLAAHDGVISMVLPEANSGGYGNMVEIKGITPDGKTYYTLYGHFMAFAKGIAPGKQVKQGDIIGYSDNTGFSSGPHLHFEYRGPSNTSSGSYGIQFMAAGCVSNPGFCNLK